MIKGYVSETDEWVAEENQDIYLYRGSLGIRFIIKAPFLLSPDGTDTIDVPCTENSSSAGDPFFGEIGIGPSLRLLPHLPPCSSLLDPTSTSQTLNIQLPMPIRSHIRAPDAFPAIRVPSLADEGPGHVIGRDGAVVARGCHWSAEVEPREGFSENWICMLLLL